MIPADVIRKLYKLDLSDEQFDQVVGLLDQVAGIVKAEEGAAIEARRANDRERKQKQRGASVSRDVTGSPEGHGTGRDSTGQAEPAKDAPTHEGTPAGQITTKTTTKNITSSLRSEGGEPPDQDADLFRRGREVLGKNCGGQISKLKAAYNGSIAKTRAVIENASTKDQPAEYVAKVIEHATNGKPMNGNRARAGPHRDPDDIVDPMTRAALNLARELSH